MSDGTGRVYRRGSVWWIDYGFRGDRHRESSGSNRKGDAVTLLRKRMFEMGKGQLVGPQEEKVTFDHLALIIEDDYAINGRKSTARLHTALAHLRPQLGHLRALDMTTDRITRYIRVRQEEGAANSSIQKELAALRRAFNLAVKAGRLSRIPSFPTLTVSNTRHGFLDRDALEAVCEHLDSAIQPIVRFAFLTAWRKQEILGLRWENVDFEAGTVRLEAGTTKNNQGREFPFGVLPELDDLLRHQRKYTEQVSRQTGRIIAHVFHRNGVPIKTLRRQWKQAATKAGYSDAWFHDLRRSAIRGFERAGISRSVAMKLSGHETEAVYRRYAIADSVALEEGVAKLAQLSYGTIAAQSRHIQPIDGRTGIA